MNPNGKSSHIVDFITNHLADVGEATRVEISVAMNTGTDKLGSVLFRMRHKHKRMPKRVYIIRWTDEAEGLMTYPRAVYALGDLPDAPKPRPKTDADYARVYRARRRGRVASVFDLGNHDKRIPWRP